METWQRRQHARNQGSHIGRSDKQVLLACRANLSDVDQVKPADLLRRPQQLATKKGWEFELVQGGRHAKVRRNGRFAPVPRHATDLPGRTLRSILKPLGITAADLEE